MPSLRVRAATPLDAAAINRIYNHYVRHTAITFEVEPWSAERRQAWIGEFGGNGGGDGDNPYHALVAELDGALAGFAFNSPFRPRAAYRRSTETTIYTAPQRQAHGIGAALYENLFQLIEKTDLHRAYAVIALPNARSVAFHRRFDFTEIGTLSEVGYKFGRYVDVAWFEKRLE